MLSNRGLGIKAKKCQYEGVIVQTALFRVSRTTPIKYLRNFVGVSRMDRVRNEEVHRRAGIERELASRADQRVFRSFGVVERINKHPMTRRVLMAEVIGDRVRGRPR